ncbi:MULTISPECIES: DUF488 domain-containing protein [Halomonadaceae]|uniref:DUF488 domain-containing protein n=1 Tax=Halomonadaceae TaxID=28256 RepID=UPI000C32B2B6|nr:DUF488 family protein [Halomonas sp. MES3-P3E]PKG52550.1 hypothetical protein CXF87_08615 [Halomonas sp. MES3-P3E]|tara:strand:- start:851 stop:1282 length:432 start_codon:yes stop_codon:yes gene_type:complete
MSYEITLKRIYAPIEEHDGSRMLVDRLWPSGLSRRSLALNEWHPEIAPAFQLCRHYLQQKISKSLFLERYSSELKTCPDKLLPLMKFTRAGRLTLLTAARQIEDSHLPVLKELTLSALAEEDASDRGFCSSPCLAHTLPTSHR